MSAAQCVIQTSVRVMSLFCIWQKVQRVLILTGVSETEERRYVDSEIRPVLLQLGVVHVNCKQLETHTHAHTQMYTISVREAIWTLMQDNRRDMSRPPQKYAFSLNLTHKSLKKYEKYQYIFNMHHNCRSYLCKKSIKAHTLYC